MQLPHRRGYELEVGGDEANVGGGALYLDVADIHRQLQMDDLMRETLFTVMGNQFGEWDQHITGVTASARRVSIWLDGSCDNTMVTAISAALRTKLISNIVRFKYVSHEEKIIRSQQSHNGGGKEDGHAQVGR